MKKYMKFFALLTAIAALFAALSVGAYADEPENDPFNMALTFSPETQLVVYIDGEWSDALSDTYGYGESVTLAAPDVENKAFAYWEADGSVISYAKELKLTVNANTTLFAVYANNAPTAEAVAGFTSITRSADGNSIAFNAIASGDKAGFVFSTKTTGNNLKIDGKDVMNVEAVKLTESLTKIPQSVIDGNNCYSYKLKPESDDTVYHVRAYVTVNGETTYGDVKDVKLSELQSGVSMVANLEGFEQGIGDDLAKLTEGMHTVTYYANGGVGAPLTQAYKGTSVALRSNTFTRDGYTFNGWSTTPGGSALYADGQSVSFSEDAVLYAQWKLVYVPDGEITVDAPISGEDETVNVTVDVLDDTAKVTGANIDKVLAAEAVGTVTIDVSALPENVNELVIPKALLTKIADAAADETNDADGLEVKLPNGTVSFDAQALAAIEQQTIGNNLRIVLDQIEESGLNEAQRSAVAEMEVCAVYDAYMTSNGQRISDFDGGTATVRVPYTLAQGQQPAGVTVWYIADDGARTQMPSRYARGMAEFEVLHFSNYVIAYDAEKVAECPKDDTCPMSAFTDLDPAAWYHDGVHFALESGILKGMGNGKFAPDAQLTRAMLVTILYRVEGEPMIRSGMPFSDVTERDWYAMAVSWAESQGYVTGYGNGKFGPNDPVTREQLATILYRYAQSKGMGFTGMWMFLLDYPDAAEVSAWADEAVHWCVMKGIINGKDGALAPKSGATRAEAATMIQRFCALIAE